MILLIGTVIFLDLLVEFVILFFNCLNSFDKEFKLNGLNLIICPLESNVNLSKSNFLSLLKAIALTLIDFLEVNSFLAAFSLLNFSKALLKSFISGGSYLSKLNSFFIPGIS